MPETSTPDAPQPPAQETPPDPTPPVDETDWKAEARKWEQRAKENKTAAERLAELESANKSEIERATEKATAAEAAAGRTLDALYGFLDGVTAPN